jgi:hypothetical protein
MIISAPERTMVPVSLIREEILRFSEKYGHSPHMVFTPHLISLQAVLRDEETEMRKKDPFVLELKSKGLSYASPYPDIRVDGVLVLSALPPPFNTKSFGTPDVLDILKFTGIKNFLFWCRPLIPKTEVDLLKRLASFEQEFEGDNTVQLIIPSVFRYRRRQLDKDSLDLRNFLAFVSSLLDLNTEDQQGWVNAQCAYAVLCGVDHIGQAKYAALLWFCNHEVLNV